MHQKIVAIGGPTGNPEEPPGCVALAIEIVKGLLIDDHRAHRRHGKYEVGLCEDPDARPAETRDDGDDAIDRRKKLEVFEQQVAARKITRRQVKIIAHAVDGVPQEEIARRMGVAAQTVKNELAEGRRTAREAWAIYGSLIAMGMLCLVVWILRDRNAKNQAHPQDAGPEPVPVQAPPPPTPQQRAAELRRTALHDCDLGRWQECADGLREAGQLDPDGNATPAVDKALRDALKHLRTPDIKQ